ncbi:hypothetical protein cypCar_00000414 [Cyprinus carpio]|nr:hypothetical protein cypCar_00000414 [Cyprinus carpio]
MDDCKLVLLLLTSNAYMWVVVCSGLIAGVLYYSNKLAVQKFLRVPGCGSVLLEPVFSDSEPTAEAPLGMGATLDIQRQQRMDMLTSNCSCLSWHTSGEMHSNNRLRPLMKSRR